MSFPGWVHSDEFDLVTPPEDVPTADFADRPVQHDLHRASTCDPTPAQVRVWAPQHTR
jgi:hypothetical protein